MLLLSLTLLAEGEVEWGNAAFYQCCIVWILLKSWQCKVGNAHMPSESKEKSHMLQLTCPVSRAVS